MLTAGDMQRAFALAYCLHPERQTAQRITYDACDWLSVLYGTQARRRAASSYKLRLSRRQCLQASVFCVSERWERDQESQTKAIPGNVYEPGAEDLLVRYVKLLVWKTMDRKACHAAVGLGCHLYQYRPEQIWALAPDLFDRGNIRRINGYRLEEIARRFPQLEMVRKAPYGEKKVHTRPPTAAEHELVLAALALFTPWQTPHLRPTESVLALFSDADPRLEWKRLHALIDTDCAGLARLVRAYNHATKGKAVSLRDPDEQLEVPVFPACGQGQDAAPGARFAPAPLSPDALVAMQHALAHNRRRRAAFSAGVLRLFADGQAQGAFDPAAEAVGWYPLPPDTGYLEIIGEDEEGELRLAVVPLAAARHQPLRLCLGRQAQHVLELCCLPRRRGDAEALLVRLRALPAPLPAWRRLLQRGRAALAPRRPAALLRPALAGLTLAALCALTVERLTPTVPALRPVAPVMPAAPAPRPPQALPWQRWVGAPLSPLERGGWSVEVFLSWPETLLPAPHAYYDALRRELSAQLLASPPMRRLLPALRDLWPVLSGLDTLEALLRALREHGLEALAQHIEATQRRHLPLRPLVVDRRLEAAAVRQGLAAAAAQELLR
ncbi:MAG: hypothetical protein KatS3mg131_3647 [Candidatus Tectimicrobiota bacterium]|nr:MAG: hypothetical protein KatS3mg131_3647 [Candidatus Tectomicrobia bacterium]